MQLTFGILAVIALLLALHPFTTYPASLALLARLRRKRAAGSIAPTGTPSAPAGDAWAVGQSAPSITICLCVFNEEKLIDRRIASLLEIADSVPGTRVAVYADGSTDGTVDKLRAWGDRIGLVVSSSRHGKTHGMNLLVKQATSDIIVFTDAAVTMAADALPAMVRAFASDPRVGCVCGRIVAVSGGDVHSSTVAASVSYWAFDATVRRLESEVASVIGAHGPLFAIRRALHVPAPVEYFDDFFVSMSILLNGHRVIQAEQFVGFKAVATRRADEYARKIRIACQSFHIHRLLAPRLRQQAPLIRYCYASHKTLRWLVIIPLTAAAVFGSLALWASGLGTIVLLGWLLFLACLALGYMNVRPFSIGLEMLGAFLANLIGVLQALSGKIYQTWTPPKSARGL